MGLGRGPTEGGSGGKRGHSGMEHWGFADEVKEVAKKRRRIADEDAVAEQREEEDSATNSSLNSKDDTS